MIRWSCASVYPTLRLLLAGLEDNTVKKPSRRPWVLPDRAFVSFLMPFRIRSSLEPTLSKYKYVTQKCYTCYIYNDISEDNFRTNKKKETKLGRNINYK